MYSPSAVLGSFLRNLSPFQKFSLLLRVIVVILYIVASLIQYELNQIEIIPSSPTYQTFKYFVYSATTPPIASLYLVPSPESCSANSYNVIFANWAKTPEVCSSQNSTIKFLDDYAEDPLLSYDSNDSAGKCVQSLDPLYIWKSYKLCGQRIQSFFHIQNTDTCPEGFIQCSQELCVSQTEQCPITDISLTYPENQLQDEATQSQNTAPLLKVSRSPDRDPIFTFEVSMKQNPCYRAEKRLSEEDLYQLPECNFYGADMDTTLIDSQRLDAFLRENNKEMQTIPPSNSTNLNLDSTGFLITRKSLIRESSNMTLKPDLKAFEERFTVLISLEAIIIAFSHTEILMFVMLFCLKHQILTNLLLLYCIVQLCTGIYIIILIRSFSKIQTSITYLFLDSHPIFSNDVFNLSIIDLKISLDQAIISLKLLSAAAVAFAIVKLIVFIAFMKLQKRWMSQPGIGPTVLDVNFNHETVGMLVGLLPVAGEHVDRNQIGGQRDLERGLWVDRNDVELRTMSSEGDEQEQR